MNRQKSSRHRQTKVRATCFRDCNYVGEDGDDLREISSFNEVVEFEESVRSAKNGHWARYFSKPKENVPTEQIALKEHVSHKITEEGNETRVHIDKICSAVLDKLEVTHKMQSETSELVMQRKNELMTHLNLDICL